MSCGYIMKPERGQRIAGLDGVRAIAVIIVIAFHTWPDAVPGGGFGVQIFFVLSGFLITSLLLQEFTANGRIDLPRFYLRRVLRLFPALYVVLFVTAVVYLIIAPKWVGLKTIAGTGLYLGNWFRAFGQWLGPLGHTWSLATEEQFYLLWPAGIILAARWLFRKNHSLPRQVAVVAVAGVLATAVAGSAEDAMGYSTARLTNTFEVASLPLWVGCAAGCVWVARYGWPRWSVPVASILAGGITACVFLVPSSDLVEHVYLALPCAVAIAFIILTISHGTWSRVLDFRGIRRVGVISYGMYLWHYPLCFLFMVKGHQGPVLMVFGLLGTYIVAEMSYRFLELPFLRMKKHHAYPKSTAVDRVREV